MKKRKIISVLIILLLVIVCCLCKMNFKNKSKGIVWDESVSTSQHNVGYIKIPGFSNLSFNANSISQDVKIFNPSTNDCLMDFYIYLDDGEIIWKAENIEPGYGFAEIELLKPIPIGKYYNGKFVVSCKNITNRAKLNGASFDVQIIVK